MQERLGHTKMDTTMSIYAHVIEEADQKSVTHFDSFFDTKTGNGNKLKKSAPNPLPKPCFEASYELMFQRTKKA